MPERNLSSALSSVCDLVDAAGRAILEIYATDFDVTLKGDLSPVTAADRLAHEVLSAGLRSIVDVPILSEEDESFHPAAARSNWASFWLVDPLDGTKEFLKRSGEFTVNVALVETGRTVLGAVHAPVLARTWFAAANQGAWFRTGDCARQPMTPALASSPLRIAVSRDHVGRGEAALLERFSATKIPAGSSLKFCYVATGEADVYARFGRTMEWDTAAAQCVAEVAGCSVVDLAGQPLRYGKPDLGNPSFVCVGDPSLVESVIRAAAECAAL